MATLIGATGFMMMNQQEPQEKVVVAENNESVVELTDSGFSPTEVTVKKGQKVKFINKTTGKMSVASDPHPDHTIYPEFDQYKTSQRGMVEFEFTFDKVGEWGYHNHLNSSQIGKIIVTN